MAAQRRLWRVWQRYMDPARFVFLDETGASTNMVRRYGWGPKSERLIDTTPHGHWHTTTFVAGLRSTGFVAPLVLDGPMTGEVFRDYVEQALAPALEPGDVLVMDNLAAHHDPRVVPACRRHGVRVVYLPPYSPDFNPIEPGWALQKQHVRKHAPRRADALRRIARRARYRVTPRHCRNWFTHAGYP